MRAVQVTGPDELVVTDTAVPAADGRALVKIQQVGICGTDVKVFHGAIPGPRPIIMGHEAVGVVVESPGDVLAAGYPRSDRSGYQLRQM